MMEVVFFFKKKKVRGIRAKREDMKFGKAETVNQAFLSEMKQVH